MVAQGAHILQISTFMHHLQPSTTLYNLATRSILHKPPQISTALDDPLHISDLNYPLQAFTCFCTLCIPLPLCTSHIRGL